MGWIRDGAYEHEGWVANVLADGRVASSSTSAGVVVYELTAGDVAAGREVRQYAGSDHIDVIVPWDQVVSWRVTCECGWVGGEQPAAADERYGDRDCPEEIKDRAFLPQWEAHVEPYCALSDLRGMVDQLRQLEQRIDDSVAAARRGGASWSQIGDVTGLTKQGAQQRWGQRDRP